MAEYIERKRAIVEACNSLGLYQSEELCPSEYAKLEDALNSIPAADVVSVRHGRWERVIPSKSAAKWSNKVSCSVCHSTGYKRFNYCPNCGAKMDGDYNG